MGSLSAAIVALLFISLCELAVVGVFSQKMESSYSLVSIEKTQDGGLVGYLKLKQSSTAYGPDIPLLRLFVK